MTEQSKAQLQLILATDATIDQQTRNALEEVAKTGRLAANANAVEPPLLLTKTAAAAYLGIHRSKMHEFIEDARRAGKGHLLLRPLSANREMVAKSALVDYVSGRIDLRPNRTSGANERVD